MDYDAQRRRTPAGARRMRRAGGHGSTVYVGRVTMEGHPGLERSMDSIAQWPHWARAQQGLRSAMVLRRSGT